MSLPKSILLQWILLILAGSIIMVACQEDEGNFSDEQMPIVTGTSPADGAADSLVNSYISVTFSKTIDSYTPTTNRDNTGCYRNFQLSGDNFNTCVVMASQPVVDGTGRIYTMRPVTNLDPYKTYKIRYVNQTGDYIYTMPTGFTTRPLPLTAKDITSFSFSTANNPVLSSDVHAAVRGVNIIFDIPFGIDISSLIADFSTSGGRVDVDGTEQTSGVTANNFYSNPEYTVAAEDGSTKLYTAIPSTVYTAGSVDFILTRIPAGLTCPYLISDSWTLTVPDAYQAGRTEVTYELWFAVYSWSVSNGYNFANAGRDLGRQTAEPYTKSGRGQVHPSYTGQGTLERRCPPARFHPRIRQSRPADASRPELDCVPYGCDFISVSRGVDIGKIDPRRTLRAALLCLELRNP